MSSSAGPSTAPSAEYAEHLANLIVIPSLSREHQYFLGPIGNSHRAEFISAEINRIPYRIANPSLGHWKNTFKSWPSLEKSWPAWYKRISASKQSHWDELGIGQALALTIANSAKDEPLIASAAYFWSNTLNAFMFNQGPMTPTLLDITMITGLDITSSANHMNLNSKNKFDFKTKSIGGWSGFISANMGQGSVNPREHTAYLLVWLEKIKPTSMPFHPEARFVPALELNRSLKIFDGENKGLSPAFIGGEGGGGREADDSTARLWERGGGACRFSNGRQWRLSGRRWLTAARGIAQWLAMA
uniref:Uncharacterized protein n=1 Tax=Oryza sativa subsp. japonica TaxID=39947 RepID=Q2QZM7_ORYSJ|nr:hypothetical protein LOC_Os11g45460 [Oryza sativa Japonica Group]